MADPAALVNAFDRSAAGGDRDVQVLSLSNLRGVSSEGIERRRKRSESIWRLARVTSTVELLPIDDTFDLWLIDNRPGPGHTTLAEPVDVLLRVGTYAVASGAHTLSVVLGPAAFTGFFPDRAFVVRSGRESCGLVRADGPQHVVRSSPAPAGPPRG